MREQTPFRGSHAVRRSVARITVAVAATAAVVTGGVAAALGLSDHAAANTPTDSPTSTSSTSSTSSTPTADSSSDSSSSSSSAPTATGDSGDSGNSHSSTSGS